MRDAIQETGCDSRLLSFIRLGVYLLLFTPLVFWKPLDYFFDSTKAFFIMGVIELMTVAYLWLICLCPAYRPKINKVWVVFTLYIAVLSFASIFGVDPFLSFWSSTDRTGGILIWLHLGALFVVVTSVIQSKKDWQNIFFVGSVVGLIVALVYLLTMIFPGFLVYSKGGSTLGNSTYLGIYLIFCIFFSAILAFSGNSKRLRRYGIASAIFSLIILFTTSAQAAILAMVGGFVFAGVLWLITLSNSKQGKVLGYSLLAGLVIFFSAVSFLVFVPGSYFNQMFIERSSGARFAAWSIAWESFQERPFLGWGLENFSVAFFAHYNPCFGSSECGYEYWFDRAHNKVLDTLVEAGVVGLVSYFCLFIVSILEVWKAYKRSDVSVAVPILFSTCLAVYFVQNLAEFDLAFSLLFFVLLLCYSSVLSYQPKKPTASQKFSMPLSLLASLATLVLPFVFFQTVIFPITTNRTDLVISAQKTGERLNAYEQQINGTPIGIDHRRIFLAGETIKLILRASKEDRQRLAAPIQQELALGIEALTDTVLRSPNELRAANLLGLLYQLDARFFDSTQFQNAEKVLERSLARNPRNQHAYSSLAAVYLAQEKKTEGLSLMQQAIDLDPRVSQPSLRMLAAVLLVGSNEEYLAKKEEVLGRFPGLDDEIKILEQVASTSKEQLYSVLY